MSYLSPIRVNSFLCLTNLKLGSFICAVIENVVSFTLFVTTSTTYMRNYKRVNAVFFSIYVLLTLTHFLFTLILTFGICVNYLKFVKLWLYFAYITVFTYPIVIIWHATKLFQQNNTHGGSVLLSTSLVFLWIHLYFIVTIRSYKEQVEYGNLEDMT